MATYFIDARSATPHFPGIGRYVTNLVTAMAAQTAPDEALEILIPPPQTQLQEQGQPWSHTLPANLHTLTATDSPFGLTQQWRVPRMMQRARGHQTKPALYHSPYYLMPYRSGLPTIVTLHDLIALVLPESVSPQARWLFRITAYAALRAASHVIIVSESARQELLNRFPIAPRKVTTVHNAAAAHFRPQSEAAIHAVRAAHQLPAEFIFYCGINKPHKNLVRLIDAYAALETSAPPLIIAGAWDDRYPEPKQHATKLNQEGRVRFIGRVSDQELPALYAAATLFVFPSLYEGFGLPVVEAMACGAPVACSDTIGLRDVAGEAALLFDPRDTSSIVAALRAAISDATLRADLRTRSLAQAQRFTWAATAQQTLAIYRDTLRANKN